MSLELSLANAVSGLQAAQANLTVIAGNIANANTPGYSREILPQTPTLLPNQVGAGVSTGVPQRVTDQILTANLRTQDSATASATTLDSYFQRIQGLFGSVGSANSLNDTLSKFSSALQTLAATPEDTVAQGNAVSAGQAIALQLNSMSSGIQTLRTNADTDIGTAVTQVNSLLTRINNFNAEISHGQALGQSTATLEDQRDQAVHQLAQQLNIQTFTRPDDSMVVLTAGGQTLVDGIAEQLQFTASGTITAASPVSGISINGTNITSSINGGNIGALLQMRDTQLPALTAELNQFANNLYGLTQVAQSSQTQTMSGTPAAGDTLTATIDGTPFTTGPLPAAPTITDVVNAINAQLGATTFTASVTGSNTLQITDSAGNPISSTIVLAGGTGTETFAAGAPGNALPTTNSGLSGPAPGDQNHFFAGVTAAGVDNAGTIQVNPSLVANPSLLDGPAGVPSPAIASALAAKVSQATAVFSAAGNFPAAQTLTLAAYAGQILGQNATAAANAHDNLQFQTGIQNDISTRAQSVSGVNMDQELANLTIYQTAYAASARVVQTVQNMYAALLAITTS